MAKGFLKEVIKEAESQGFTVVKCRNTKRGHTKLYIRCNDGKVRFVTVSGSPSDRRVLKNIINTVRKTAQTGE